MTRCKELRRSPLVHSTVVSPTLIIAHPGLGRMYRQLPNTFSLPAGRTCRPPMTLNSSVIVPISVCPPKVIELSCSSGVGWLRKRRTEVSDVSSSVFNELSVPDLIPSCSSRRDCTAATIAWEWRINCSISFRRISIESASSRLAVANNVVLVDGIHFHQVQFPIIRLEFTGRLISEYK